MARLLKAVREQGVRLNTNKATLRNWRSEFARNLRLLGVPANATERAVRAQDHNSKKDGIYRARQRGDSTYLRAQAASIASDLMKGDVRRDPGKRRLIETRKNVVQGWAQVATALKKDGELMLAQQVRSFAAGFSPPRTDREWVATELISKIRAVRTSNREMIR